MKQTIKFLTIIVSCFLLTSCLNEEIQPLKKSDVKNLDDPTPSNPPTPLVKGYEYE